MCERALGTREVDEPGRFFVAIGPRTFSAALLMSASLERFGRPAIVIAEEEGGIGKGSGRSISGVDLGAAVLAAKEQGLLTAGGGHAMAAGLTMPAGGHGQPCFPRQPLPSRSKHPSPSSSRGSIRSRSWEPDSTSHLTSM